VTGWGETQLEVARDFQEACVPLYRRPFPAVPTCADGHGGRRPCPRPFFGFGEDGPLSYRAYRTAVEGGRIVPRPIHGCLHAARVALFAGLLAQLHRRAGRPVGDLRLLQMAAAFHDAAREDEGRDRWDSDSAALFGRWLRERNLGDPDRWAALLDAKDDERPSSLEQEILHDADALDIQRTAHAAGNLDTGRLFLFRAPNRISPADKDALVAEAGRFIALTEHGDVKRWFEDLPDCYVMLMHLLLSVDREVGTFPLMSSLLSELLDS